MKWQEYIAVINRFVGLAATLVIMLLNLHFVGISGQGEISLINFGILLFASISQFIGGGALVYLIPRLGEQRFIFPALLWLVGAGIISLIALHFLDAKFIFWILLLGALQSYFFISQMLLLARAKVGQYQILLFTQAIASILFIYWSYSLSSAAQVIDFIQGQAIAFFITAAVGQLLTFKQISRINISIDKEAFSSAFSLGAYTQTGNIFHLFNQRSYLFFLERISIELTGIYSILNYISEGILSVTKSLAAIQNSIIAQDDNHDLHLQLTRRYLLIGLVATSIGIATFILLPTNWLEVILKSKTFEVKHGFYFLIPGILAGSITATLAHYFSGKGLQKYNAYSAIAGFSVAVPVSAVLIPMLKIDGACIAASATFLVQCLVQIVLFRKATLSTQVK